MSQMLSHSLSIPVAFLLIAYLQIVLGELCPKSIALRDSEN
jgi:CBS domain containing-hemolysin-like protein